MAVTSDDVYLNYLQQIEIYLQGHEQQLGDSCPALHEAIIKVQDLKNLSTELDKCYISQYEKNSK